MGSNTNTVVERCRADVKNLPQDSFQFDTEHIEVYKSYDFSEAPEVASPHRVMNVQKAKSSPASNRIVHNTNTKIITGSSDGGGVFKGGATFKKR